MRRHDDVKRDDEVEAAEFLEHMARGGTTLGVAIGTGSIALPLASQGIRVDGIDISTAMVSRLRAKPGGTGISVTHTSRRHSGVSSGPQLTSQ